MVFIRAGKIHDALVPGLGFSIAIEDLWEITFLFDSMFFRYSAD
jgi:hypothetical protein